MLTRIAATLFVVGLIALAGGSAPVSTASFPGANGKIVFESNRDGNSEIYVMNADGTAQTNLTNNPAVDSKPAWSPDGTRIAFTSDRAGTSQVWMMNSDGSSATQLTNDPVGAGGPTWSPDGTRIAFHGLAAGNYDIYSMDVGFGGAATELTNGPQADTNPAWSPDGVRIAFVRNGDIWVMNADGSNQTRLTNTPADEIEADWSPDGSRIAFASPRDGGIFQVFVMNSDGSAQTRVTNDPVGAGHPSWSPDGTKMAFHSVRDGAHDIWVMDVNGDNQVRLTTDPATDFGPNWQPLGRMRGDINCDGTSNSVDALFVLRHTATLPVTMPPGCPTISWPASHGPNPIVSSGAGSLDGTWHFDFDTGAQVQAGDIWWDIIEYIGHTVGDIVPNGDARVVNLGAVDFDSLTYSSLWYLPFSTNPIHGSDDASSQLAPGDVFAVLTSDGNVAKVRVEAYAYTLQLRWVTYQGAPRGDVNCDGQVNTVDSLFILRHTADLPVNLPPGCPAIGA